MSIDVVTNEEFIKNLADILSACENKSCLRGALEIMRNSAHSGRVPYQDPNYVRSQLDAVIQSLG